MTEKINLENRDFSIKWSEQYKKLDSLSLACEEYKRKDYFNELNLAQSRLKYRERSRTLSTCRFDYSSDQANIKALYQCFHCSQIDIGGSHWRVCEGYSRFRMNKNLENDVDLVTYFKQIIELRKNEIQENNT